MRQYLYNDPNKRAVVKWILRVTLTPVLASHWLAQFLVSNERLELAYESLSKSTLQRPFLGRRNFWVEKNLNVEIFLSDDRTIYVDVYHVYQRGISY